MLKNSQLNTRILVRWPFAGWDLLTAALCAAAVLFLVLTYVRPAKAVLATERQVGESPRPAYGTDVSGGRSWTPFDAYAPFFTSRDIFSSAEEKSRESGQQESQAVVDPTLHWGEGYQLAGVMVDSDPRAVVKASNPPEVHTLAVGQELGGAVLVSVDEDKAVFEYQKQQFTLTLDPKDGQ